jgi:hypothetical protein
MSNSTSVIAGSNGFKRHASGTVTGVAYDAVIPQEDTVFTSFSVNGTNVLSDRGMSGVTFKQGAYLSAGSGLQITGFVTSSGSVIGY